MNRPHPLLGRDDVDPTAATPGPADASDLDLDPAAAAVVPEDRLIVGLLRELAALDRGVERHLAVAMQLNATDLHALEFLSRTGASTPTGLAVELGVSTPAATFAVDRLEARGHVRRRPHPDDRRKTVVEPSPSAVAEVVGLLTPLTSGLGTHLAGLDAADRRAVEAFLAGVVQVYRDAQREWDAAG